MAAKENKKKGKRLAALFSSGKDSAYAIYKMKKKGYEISCLISMISENLYSYMFHTPGIEMAELQAEAMEIPIIIKKTKGEKEKELNELKDAIKEAKDKYDIEGVVTGALYSQYQKERIDKICKELGLKAYSPLWHMDQEKEMKEILESGFHIIFTGVAAYGLNHGWLGRKITKRDINKLVGLNKAYSINVAGEGGEFESLVIDCPLFKKKLVIKEFTIMEEKEYTARMLIQKACLEEK